MTKPNSNSQEGLSFCISTTPALFVTKSHTLDL